MTMEIRVFGPGCSRCRTLAERTEDAVRELGIDANIEEVHDALSIAALGIMATPALALDGRLVMAGQVPTVVELEGLIGEAAQV
jgi:small redox-active disulfide protein 2